MHSHFRSCRGCATDSTSHRKTVTVAKNSFLASMFLAALNVAAQADVYRWDNRLAIPGTEGIGPGPGVMLDHRDLAFADLSDKNLSDSRFDFSNLSRAFLINSTLINADLSGANLTNALLIRATLTNANLSGPR